MLSKKVCKFCYEKHGVEWAAENDKWWFRGWILCNAWMPFKGMIDELDKDCHSTNSKAKCEFSLEHEMETQNEI